MIFARKGAWRERADASLTGSLTLCGLFVLLATPAFAQTLLTKCQVIKQSGDYWMRITTLGTHRGPCLDIEAPNVSIVAPGNSWIDCNGADNGIRVESTANGFSLSCRDAGCALNGCVTGVHILHQPAPPGSTVDLSYGHQLFINGSAGCRHSVKADDSENVVLSFGAVQDATGDGLEGTCPGGDMAPWVGGQQRTYVSGTLGGQ